ncbi:MAG: hypothetical protein ACRD09_10610 [Vicinamibacterales bacterium]
MRKSIRLLVLSPILFAIAVPAAAQVTDRPSRPFRGLFGGGPPPDPNRTRQELTLTASMLGGYDDNIGHPLTGSPTDSYESGYAGLFGTALRYWRGRAERAIEVHGRGYLSALSVLQTDPTVGGDLDLNGRTNLGRLNRVAIGQRLSSRPYQALGAFGALDGLVPVGLLPESNPTYGLGDSRSWSSDTTVSLSRAWTSRTSAGGGYSYTIRDYQDDVGFDTRSQNGWLDFTRALGRYAGLTTTYRYATWEQPTRAGGDGTIANHTIDAGVRFARRLSRTRSLGLSAGFGATRAQTFAVDTDRLDYWTPSAHGSLSVDVGRSWAVRADYQRTVMVLDAVARQAFNTDAAFLQLDGLLGRRLDLMLSSGYADGRTGLSGAGRYESHTAGAQLRYAVARCCAALASYNYYHHRLHGIVTVPEGFPRRFDRNAVRVGLTLWLPLYGTYTDGAERRRPPSGRS